jgi:hypothetical protein
MLTCLSTEHNVMELEARKEKLENYGTEVGTYLKISKTPSVK